MVSFDDLRIFMTIVSARSLVGAARRLDISPPAVTQRLQSLERRLGVHLIDRSGARIILTDEGQMLARRAAVMLGELADLEDDVRTRRNVISGRLRVIAASGFGRRYVAPVAAEFQAANPGVSVDLALSDRLGGFPDESWDVAVHVGALRDSSLTFRHLAPNERFVCASPEYLRHHGTPATPQDLRKHCCIALRENDEDVTMWRFRRFDAEEGVRIEPLLASNDGDVVRGWATAGHGIVVRSEWDMADELASGKLVRVLEDYAVSSADVVALLGSGRRGHAPRTLAFLDALLARLTPVPWRI